MTNLEYAIKMELDGEQYYLRQAELNDDQGVKVVCNLLAEDERRHAQVLRDKSNQLAYQLEDSNILANTKNVFADRGDIIIADKAKQLDFYREAVKLEEESIKLYKELLEKAEDDEDKDIFKFLIEQEENHLQILDSLASMLRHAEEWVEDAEFGVRPEY